MEYTKGEWVLSHGSFGRNMKTYVTNNDKEIIAGVEADSEEELLANAHLISAAPDLYEACRATDRYFKACLTAWVANGGKLVDNKGNAIAEADGLDTLCDTAGEMIVKALAKAEGKE